MQAYSEKQQSYWKLTGDTVIVLFASNIMVPLTVGSFLRILKQRKHHQILKIKILLQSKANPGKKKNAKHILTCTPFSQWSGPRLPTARSISSAA
jgi:hypothetical protein